MTKVEKVAGQIQDSTGCLPWAECDQPHTGFCMEYLRQTLRYLGFDPENPPAQGAGKKLLDFVEMVATGIVRNPEYSDTAWCVTLQGILSRMEQEARRILAAAQGESREV